MRTKDAIIFLTIYFIFIVIKKIDRNKRDDYCLRVIFLKGLH